jgi:predicted phage-related endonuclease
VIARNRRYVHNEHPFIGSEIDVELLVDGEEVNGEAKTVSPFAAKLWGAPDSNDVPLYYQAQCMHALSVYPRRRTVIGAMVGLDDFRVRWIERDDDLIQIITAKEVDFWQDVQAGRMPAPTTAGDVAWLYQDRGEAVEITADAALAVEKLRQIKQQQAALDAEREQLELKIQLQMRDAATALDSTGRTLATWRKNKERQTTDWQAVAQALGASPALIEQHTRTEPGARVFRLTKG